MTLYNKLDQRFSQNYFSAAALTILVQSCLGGATAMTVLSHGTSLPQFIQLAIVTIISIMTNTFILAGFSKKAVLNFVLFNFAVNTLILIINTFLL